MSLFKIKNMCICCYRFKVCCCPSLASTCKISNFKQVIVIRRERLPQSPQMGPLCWRRPGKFLLLSPCEDTARRGNKSLLDRICLHLDLLGCPTPKVEEWIYVFINCPQYSAIAAQAKPYRRHTLHCL